MNKIIETLESTIGQKILTALTGLGMVGFLIGHLAGNLLVFSGSDALNAYAHELQTLGPLLWVARFGLLLLIVTHVAITIKLTIRSRRSAGRYAKNSFQRSTRSSRWMMVSGSFILLFLLFHLAHFTFKWIDPAYAKLEDVKGRHDVFAMVNDGFLNWPIAILYVASMAVIFSHLSHALFSILQTLGFGVGEAEPLVKRVAGVVALLITVGFAAIPISFLMGIVGQQ